jgi:hypothetical protein
MAQKPVKTIENVRTALSGVFLKLLHSEWPAFHNSVLSDLLRLDQKGYTAPTVDHTDLIHLYMKEDKRCHCLASESANAAIISVRFESYSSFMRTKTIAEGSQRVCSECKCPVPSPKYIFVYDDALFCRSVGTNLTTEVIAHPIQDIMQIDALLETYQFLFVYFFRMNSAIAIEHMEKSQLDVMWVTAKLNFDKPPYSALTLTGASLWTENMNWPVIYAHSDEARCTCIGTAIENCCTRFDFPMNLKQILARTKSWKHCVFFTPIGRAIHHIIAHTRIARDQDTEDKKINRYCSLCQHRIEVTDFFAIDSKLANARIEAGAAEDDTVKKLNLESTHESQDDSELGVEDRSPRFDPIPDEELEENESPVSKRKFPFVASTPTPENGNDIYPAFKKPRVVSSEVFLFMLLLLLLI